MPETLQSPVNALTSVDWFKAKLQFEMGPVELKRLLDEKGSLMVIDVRDRDSYAKEHVPGAANIPLTELQKRLNDLPHEKTLVLYCWSLTCHMATKAALDLAHHDYKVAELVGGIKEWKLAGYPIEGADRQTAPA
jgi:rhodanese-related sulfurtransferase